MVQGSGKYGAPSLGIGYYGGKLVINRIIDLLLEIPLKIAQKSPRVNPIKYFTLITL